MNRWIALLGLTAFLLVTGCDNFPFPIGEGRDVVLDLPVLQRHWVPDPKVPGCGTLYILADGDAGDLARHSASFDRLVPPISDKRFVHTSPGIAWWVLATPPDEVYCKASVDHPLTSPDARAEYEFVIMSKGNRVYYEQRTLPLRAPGAKPPSVPAASTTGATSKKNKAEQGGAGQPATRSESPPEDGSKPPPESEGRSR